MEKQIHTIHTYKCKLSECAKICARIPETGTENIEMAPVEKGVQNLDREKNIYKMITKFQIVKFNVHARGKNL